MDELKDLREVSRSAEKMNINFSRLIHTYNLCMIRILDKYGLYPGQPQVLFAVSAEDRQMTQNELALRMNVSKASVGKSLCRLEEGGFIKRVRDKRDSRCIRVALTKKGKEYARWCEIDFELLYTTMLECFDSDERDMIPGLIDRMNACLDGLRQRLEN